MERPQVLDRLQKLLSRTTANGATEAEAQTALAMAQTLMDAHNVAMADVSATGGAAALFGEHTARTDASLGSHYVVAIGLVEKVFAVRGIVRQSKKTGPNGRATLDSVSIGFFGDPVNVASAGWALNYLGPIFRGLWDGYRTRTGAKTGAMLGYYCGLRDGFLARLETQRAARELAAPGSKNALALVTDRLNAAFGAANPNTRNIVKRGHDSAYGDGTRDGRSINLARPIEQAARRGLASR